METIISPEQFKPPDKKILGHREQTRLKNKETNEFIIKCGLDKSLIINHNFKNALLKEIKLRTFQASKAHHRVGILITSFLNDCISSTKKPWEINIPKELFSQSTFVYQLITGTDKSRIDLPEVKNILKKHEGTIFTEPLIRRTGDRNSLVTIASQYITTFKTYLQENFERKQLAFLSKWCEIKGFEKGYISKIRYRINGWETPGKTREIFSPEIERLINFHRKLLCLEDNDKVSLPWVKNNYIRIIIYFSVLSRYLVKKGNQAILVAPQPKIKMNFLFIDKSVFYGILKDIKYIDKKNKFDSKPEDFYEEVFNLNKLTTLNQKTSGFKFTGTIQTDCCSICFHMRKPKLYISSQEKNLDRNDPNIRVIAQDPGRSTLFYGVEEIGNGEFKKYKLTRNHFYTVSGAKEAVKNTNKWVLGIKHIQDKLSQTNKRTEFFKYSKIVMENYDKLWEEYTKQRYARQRFAVYSGKKRVYDKFFRSLVVPGKKTVIAYGDGGFASSSKYELSAPTTNLEKQCSKWFKIVKVDEFRTTKLHYETGQVLSKVIEKSEGKAEKSVKTVRGLLWFNSTKEGKFIDRDYNAAKNILKCYRVYPKRPEGMDRKILKLEEPGKHYIYKKERVQESILKNSEVDMWSGISCF